jgi:sirohydrochlorin ferrochelatase
MPQSNGPEVPGEGTTAQRLASEMREVQAAIALVRSGAATTVSLAGLRFAEPVLRELAAQAERDGIALVPIYWPEDAGCDVTVRRLDVDA